MPQGGPQEGWRNKVPDPRPRLGILGPIFRFLVPPFISSCLPSSHLPLPTRLPVREAHHQPKGSAFCPRQQLSLLPGPPPSFTLAVRQPLRPAAMCPQPHSCPLTFHLNEPHSDSLAQVAEGLSVCPFPDPTHSPSSSITVPVNGLSYSPLHSQGSVASRSGD